MIDETLHYIRNRLVSTNVPPDLDYVVSIVDATEIDDDGICAHTISGMMGDLASLPPTTDDELFDLVSTLVHEVSPDTEAWANGQAALAHMYSMADEGVLAAQLPLIVFIYDNSTVEVCWTDINEDGPWVLGPYSFE